MIVKDNTPTAFDELAEWCEKHMQVGEYQIVPQSRSYQQTIYLNVFDDETPFVCFNPSGAVICAGVLTYEDRLEHIRDLEATERERGTASCEK